MDLIKDILKCINSGLAEFWLECKVSDKRREYFQSKKGKLAKFCFYISLLVVIGLLIAGIIALIYKKIVGVLLLCASIGIGLFMLVEWGMSGK
nr:hypothetical protein [uncultured Sellimonas sp.]